MYLSLDFDDLSYDAADNRRDAFRKLLVSSHHKADGYNVILLDGNLCPERTDGSDAKLILRYIGRLQLPVAVIGMSSQPMSDYDISLNPDLTKEGVFDLTRVIDDLSPVQDPFYLSPSR